MTVSDEELRQRVDAVLEPAWAHERRRALWRTAGGSALRWAIGMAAIAVLALSMRFAFGMVLPWFFFLGIGLLAGIAVLPDPGDQGHLRK